jgi:uncharacterized protein
MKAVLASLSVFLALPVLCYAQHEPNRARPPSVTASAEAVITLEPDQAEIDIGTVTQARNAPDAARDNAEKLSRVVAELKKLLGKDDEIKTVSYSLTPNYHYPQRGKAEITGYTAANTVRVRTGNLAVVAKLIDTAMQTGANAIHRLQFNVKDEQAAQLQALRQASSKAQAKAEAMADALGLKVIQILSLAEIDRGVRPLVVTQARGVQLEAMATAPTPIETGTIEVRSSVTLVAELGSR